MTASMGSGAINNVGTAAVESSSFTGQLADWGDAIRDEITNLTTAVDVALDEAGNIYVAEITTGWATPMINQDFELFASDGPPDPGGYPRFSGRVSLIPADQSERVILADDLDSPTNLTCHEGRLFVSTGPGAPNRRITGETYAIGLDARALTAPAIQGSPLRIEADKAYNQRHANALHASENRAGLTA